MDKSNSRINILSKVVTSDGKFDDKKWHQILGEYYDNFINFCNHLKILDDVDKVTVCEFSQSTAKFTIQTKDGRFIEIES